MTEMTSNSQEQSKEKLREWIRSIRDLIPLDIKLNWLSESALVELAANIEVQLEYLKQDATFQTCHDIAQNVVFIKRKDAEYDLAERIKEARKEHRKRRDLEKAEATIKDMRAKTSSPFAGLGL